MVGAVGTWHRKKNKIRCLSVQLGFGFYDFEFKTRIETFVADLGWG